jgi:hypothetical protein
MTAGVWRRLSPRTVRSLHHRAVGLHPSDLGEQAGHYRCSAAWRRRDARFYSPLPSVRAFGRSLHLICPLLTSPPRSQALRPVQSGFPDAPVIFRGKIDRLHRTPAGFTTPALDRRVNGPRIHHQPEARHPKSSAIHKLGRPITRSLGHSSHCRGGQKSAFVRFTQLATILGVGPKYRDMPIAAIVASLGVDGCPACLIQYPYQTCILALAALVIGSSCFVALRLTNRSGERVCRNSSSAF